MKKKGKSVHGHKRGKVHMPHHPVNMHSGASGGASSMASNAKTEGGGGKKMKKCY